MQEISAERVRDELQRILASPGFTGAGRLGPFLRYLVDAALNGDTGKLKESVLGIDVFQRKPDYDPRIDPIVRVEARRLRSRLDEYYRTAGAGDEVVIDLPKGAYVPVFRERNGEPAPVEPVPAETVENGAAVAAALDPPVAPVREHAFHRTRRIRWAIGIVILLAATITWWAIDRRRTTTTADDRSIAVLPFQNLSTEADNEYFADGLTTELTDTLTRAGNLRVIAWTSASQYKGKAYDVQEVGKRFNVGNVLEGSVRRAGNRLRITAQLIDAGDGRNVWSQSYDRELRDIFSVQEEIAKSIAGALRTELRVGGKELLSERYTANLDAYNLYLRGRAQMNRYSRDGMQRGIDYLTQAASVDPKYAPAYAAMSGAYGLLGYYREDPPDAWAKAKAAAQRAVDLDPNLAEAHSALCFAYGAGEWKWDLAKTECERAIDLNPGSADAHFLYAMSYLAPMGRVNDAIREARKSQDLDPLTFLNSYILGYLYTMNHQEQQGIAEYKRALEIVQDNGNAWWDLGMAYAFAGQMAEAEKNFRRRGQIVEGGNWEPGVPELVLLGRMDDARRRADRLRNYTGWRLPMDGARMFGLVGDAAQCAKWLEKAYEVHDGDLMLVKIDRRFDKVRNAPEVQAVLRKIGVAN